MIGGARIRLNGWQQAAVAVGSAVGAFFGPRRADLIAALGETTGRPAFEKVLERMKKSPEGRVSRRFILFNFEVSIPQAYRNILRVTCKRPNILGLTLLHYCIYQAFSCCR